MRLSALCVSQVSSAASSGVACLAEETDVYGRPIIVIRAARHFPGRQAENEKLAVFLVEQAMRRLKVCCFASSLSVLLLSFPDLVRRD